MDVPQIPVQIGMRRVGDPPILVGDGTRIENEMGWKQVFPDLHAVIESAWKWHGTYSDMAEILD